MGIYEVNNFHGFRQKALKSLYAKQGIDFECWRKCWRNEFWGKIIFF